MALGTLEAAVPLPWFMTQGSLPPIHGIDWSPSKALEFTLDLPASTASQEILRFILERHDGHYDLMRTLLEQTPADKVFDGEGWHDWCKVFTDEVEGALNARFPSETDLEVIPRRPASPPHRQKAREVPHRPSTDAPATRSLHEHTVGPAARVATQHAPDPCAR